jgi:hypothetical protein
LDSSLTLSVVNSDLNVYGVVWIVENLWDHCRNGNVVVGFDAREATTVLNVVLKDELVTCKSLNTHLFYFIKLLFFLCFISNQFSFFNISNSLRLQKSSLLLAIILTHLALIAGRQRFFICLSCELKSIF